MGIIDVFLADLRRFRDDIVGVLSEHDDVKSSALVGAAIKTEIERQNDIIDRGRLHQKLELIAEFYESVRPYIRLVREYDVKTMTDVEKFKDAREFQEAWGINPRDMWSFLVGTPPDEEMSKAICDTCAELFVKAEMISSLPEELLPAVESIFAEVQSGQGMSKFKSREELVKHITKQAESKVKDFMASSGSSSSAPAPSGEKFKLRK